MFSTQALRQTRPGAQYVVWPRIDQKSCLKAIAAAGCVPLVVENLLEGDELRTDVAGVREKIASVGAEQVLGYTYYDRSSAILTMTGPLLYLLWLLSVATLTIAIPLWLYHYGYTYHGYTHHGRSSACSRPHRASRRAV